jgi:hypothetical protein
VFGTLQRDSVARQDDLFHAFGAACGTRDVNYATAVRTGKIFQQYKTSRDVPGVRISSLYQEVGHNA